MRRRNRQIWSESRGLTLVELMVAISLFMVVLAGAVPVLISAVNTEPRIRDRADKVQRARVMLETMGRDLRLGYQVDSAGSSTLVFRTYLHQTSCAGSADASAPVISCRVTYTCTSSSCTRQVANPDGSAPGAAREVAGGLSSVLFTASDQNLDSVLDHVEVRATFPAETSEDAITLSDGFGLRNVGLSS